MRHSVLFFAAALFGGLFFTACTMDQSPKIESLTLKNYPESRKDESVIDDYAGTKVADPYRWLEDDNSEETAAWVGAQNEVTQDYLTQISFRQNIRDRYEELFNYPKLSSPFKAGEYYFFKTRV